MKRWKRIVAGLLCATLLFTQDVTLTAAWAQGTEQEETKGEVQQSQTPDQVDVQQTEQRTAINYVYRDNTYVDLPGEQNILIGFHEETGKVTDAVLHTVKEETGEEFLIPGVGAGQDFQFTMRYENASQQGSYRIAGVEYVVDGETQYADFRLDDGLRDMRYGVGKKIDAGIGDAVVVEEKTDAEEEAVTQLVQEDTDVAIVRYDAGGQENGDQTIQDAIEQAKEEVQQAVEENENIDEEATGDRDVVVCLDPGHGGTDPGAVANGVQEKDLNLAIARACRDELNTYAGVKVVMTRDSDVKIELETRAEIAKNAGASVFVSIHNNWAANAGASGSMVFYPNGSYRPDIGNNGRILAEHILNQLVALGLKNNGVKIRNSETGTTYEDGSLADYYAVIKHTKKRGIPGIIVEHAFISNGSDVANHLGNADQLRQLGVADAHGIAEYFGLKKGLITPTMTKAQVVQGNQVELNWTGVTNADIYEIYRKEVGQSAYKKIHSMAAYITYWTDTTASEGKKYQYKVRGTKKVDGTTLYSKFSNELTVNILKVPTIASVTSSNSKKIKVTWKKVSGASGYEIRRRDKDGKYQIIGKVEGENTVTYFDTKPEEGLLYYYKIRAFDQQSTTAWSKAKTGNTLSKPELLSITRSSKSVKLQWKEVKEADGYFIIRSEKKNEGYVKVKNISDPKTLSYVDSGIKTNKDYYYKVRAYRQAYNIESSGYINPVIAYRAKPSISSIKVAGNGLKLTWKKVSTAKSYQIYRSLDKTGGFKRIATVSNAGQYVDKTIEKNTTYYYRIRIKNKVESAEVYGPYSTIEQGELNFEQGDDLSAPAPDGITGFAVRSNTSTRLKLSWKKVNGADGYSIYRSEEKEGSFKRIKTIQDASTVVYLDGGRETGKTYYYRMRSFKRYEDGAKYSKYTAVKSVAPLKKTVISSILSPKSEAVTLTWNEIDDVDYMIYRSTEEKGTYQLVDIVSGDAQNTYTDTGLTLNKTYFYKVRTKQKQGSVINYGSSSTVASQRLGYSIAGPTTITLSQMIAFYNKSGKKYPAAQYKNKGASTLQKFCQIVMDEANAEGIPAEVVWSQICLETGYLSFPGDVKPDQCNFGGLGAVGNGVTGEVFPNVRTGIRAQVQHLKAYGTNYQLNKKCVDPRFQYVERGCAPIVEWLGIQENPKKKGWATQQRYGYNLVGIIQRIKECE